MVDILSNFSAYDSFEEFCLKECATCPMKGKNDAHDPVCHRCKVAYLQGVEGLKNYIKRRLE